MYVDHLKHIRFILTVLMKTALANDCLATMFDLIQSVRCLRLVVVVVFLNCLLTGNQNYKLRNVYVTLI